MSDGYLRGLADKTTTEAEDGSLRTQADKLAEDIICSSLVLSQIAFSEPVISEVWEIACNSLVLGSLILSEPSIIYAGDIACDTLVLGPLLFPTIYVSDPEALAPDIIQTGGAIERYKTIAGTITINLTIKGELV